jgi:hypothetical protein
LVKLPRTHMKEGRKEGGLVCWLVSRWVGGR